jgi:hypothetical protein
MSNMQVDLFQFAKRLLLEDGHDPDMLTDAKVKACVDIIPRKDQIRLLAMRSEYRNAGGQTRGTTNRGIPGSATDKTKMAARLQMLAKNFDHSTPDDSSVFWTGIDNNKLRWLVQSWNKQNPGKIFGQLEATTDTRFMDGVLTDWGPGGGATAYFEAASVELGKQASGHVTSIQRFGLQTDPGKIFTHKEFPALLKGMDDDLGKGQPRVTDITIVVVDPIGFPGIKCKSFTNLEINNINLIDKVGDQAQIFTINQGKPAGKVGMHGVTKIPEKVRSFWLSRYPKPVSQTALVLAKHIESILYGSEDFDFNRSR